MTGFLAGLLAGALGALGVGGGGVLLLYLTAVGTEPESARGINLIFFLFTAAVSLFFHGKNGFIRWETAKTAVLWGIPGALFGFFLGAFLPKESLRIGFALFLLVLGLREFFGKSEKTVDK